MSTLRSRNDRNSTQSNTDFSEEHNENIISAGEEEDELEKGQESTTLDGEKVSKPVNKVASRGLGDDMMFCFECGEKILKISKFCSHCGAKQLTEGDNKASSILREELTTVPANLVDGERTKQESKGLVSVSNRQSQLITASEESKASEASETFGGVISENQRQEAKSKLFDENASLLDTVTGRKLHPIYQDWRLLVLRYVLIFLCLLLLESIYGQYFGKAARDARRQELILQQAEAHICPKGTVGCLGSLPEAFLQSPEK